MEPAADVAWPILILVHDKLHTCWTRVAITRERGAAKPSARAAVAFLQGAAAQRQRMAAAA